MPLLTMQSAKGYGFGQLLQSSAIASYESIQTVSVTSGTSATLVFSSIPQTYKHLQIRGYTASAYNNSGTGASAVAVQFNTATGSGRTDYSRAFVQGNGSSPSGVTATSTWGGMYENAWNNVNSTGTYSFSPVLIDIYNYSSTTLNKTAIMWSGFETSTASTNRHIRYGGFAWYNTDAINSITFDQNSWIGDGFFRAGSKLSLYGVK